MAVLSNNDLKRLNKKIFCVYPFDESCITPVGYDLNIGAAILMHSGSKLVYNSDNHAGSDSITIPPMSSIIIITKESVWLSDRVAGFLYNRGSYAAIGTAINASTIDPNWSGQMIMRLNNFTEKSITIDSNKPFATMCLHLLISPTQDKPIGGPRTALQRLTVLYNEPRLYEIFANFVEGPNNKSRVNLFGEQVDEAKRYINFANIPAVIKRSILKYLAGMAFSRRGSIILIACVISISVFMLDKYLFGYIYTNNPTLVNYATVVSLLLAVLSIFLSS